MTKALFMQQHLKNGEQYAGLILGQKCQPDQHIFLLPGDTQGSWGDRMKWAASIGGDLPSRAEQRILFANVPDQFQYAWYWSNTQHAALSDYAWDQYFDDGDQYDGHKSSRGRARAVRRLIIL